MSRTSSACASQTNMKSGVSRKKLPASPAEWEAVIAAAPGENRPPIAKEKASWANAVVVKVGGYQAARTALATKRKQGQRGPRRSPTKQSVSQIQSGGAGLLQGNRGRLADPDERSAVWIAGYSRSARSAEPTSKGGPGSPCPQSSPVNSCNRRAVP